MLNQDTKRKIDSARQILVGRVPDPKSQVDEITTALVYKFLDDLDKQSQELGGKTKFFMGEFAKYSWSKLMDPRLGGQERLNLYSEAITSFHRNVNLPQFFREIFKDAFLRHRSTETLNLFLKEVNDFNYEHSEDLGDAFEYLLSVLGSQGDAGQFRTPRHIIDFIVAAVNPKKDETICDPACGTAGFLISAYKHILKENEEKSLTPDERKTLMDHFAGYDISPDMVRLSKVNLYLHGFPSPTIFEYDTLSSEEKWDESFDVMLANPPFMSPKGGIKPHKRFSVQANRSEVLFVDYILEHLRPKGRAGIIVPEGIIFKSETAYKALRKMLVEDGLVAVVSLPAGVFNPYAGVKTSILLFDKEIAKKTKNILFLKIQNDGFDLGAQRREHDKNDLPLALAIIKKYKSALKNDEDFKFSEEENKIAHLVAKEKIAVTGDFNLSGDRYKEVINFTNQKWPMVELGEVCEVLDSKRKPVTKADRKQGKYPYYGATGIVDHVDDYIFDEKLVLIGEDGAKWGVGEKTAFIAEGKYWVNNHAHVLRPRKEKVLDDYIVPVINSMDLTPYITGVTVPKLNQKKLRSIKIPLPPLEVQKEIVEQIEKYQKIIDGATQVVVNWKPKINIDPEWERVKLGNLAKFVRGPFGGNLKKEIFKPEGYLIYEQYHAINNDFSFARYFIDKEKFKEMKRFEISEGDILVSCSGTMGKMAIVPKNHMPGIINQALLKLTPNNTIVLTEYLKTILESDHIQSKHFQNQSGVAIQNVSSVKVLSEINIPLPPLEIQKQIVAEIEEEQKIIEANKKIIVIMEHKIAEIISEI